MERDHAIAALKAHARELRTAGTPGSGLPGGSPLFQRMSELVDVVEEPVRKRFQTEIDRDRAIAF
jgi:hypothetical protein